MKTIGLLGGMSWESTATYYRLINEGVKRRLGGLHSAQLLLYTGSNRLGRPSMGSWITYGLGSENENLPGFVVPIWGSGPVCLGSSRSSSSSVRASG